MSPKKGNIVSANDNTVFQINLKTPAQSLINIYADGVIQLDEAIEALNERVPAIVALEQSFGAVSVVAKAVGMAPPAEQRAVQVSVTPQASNVMCECGIPAKLVPGGISKTSGKPYKAFYACAQPREAQCQFRANS
jgi:hypothetical protein